MRHRHLNHQQFTLAAIDDIISRGRWNDWVELRRATLEHPEIVQDIHRICDHYISDPCKQRYHFWKNYAIQQASA